MFRSGWREHSSKSAEETEVRYPRSILRTILANPHLLDGPASSLHLASPSSPRYDLQPPVEALNVPSPSYERAHFLHHPAMCLPGSIDHHAERYARIQRSLYPSPDTSDAMRPLEEDLMRQRQWMFDERNAISPFSPNPIVIPPRPPPNEWCQAFDPLSGRPYYYHTTTRQTRWNLPTPQFAVPFAPPTTPPHEPAAESPQSPASPMTLRERMHAREKEHSHARRIPEKQIIIAIVTKSALSEAVHVEAGSVTAHEVVCSKAVAKRRPMPRRSRKVVLEGGKQGTDPS